VIAAVIAVRKWWASSSPMAALVVPPRRRDVGAQLSRCPIRVSQHGGRTVGGLDDEFGCNLTREPDLGGRVDIASTR
jgi:hypothetical protein